MNIPDKYLRDVFFAKQDIEPFFERNPDIAERTGGTAEGLWQLVKQEGLADRLESLAWFYHVAIYSGRKIGFSVEECGDLIRRFDQLQGISPALYVFMGHTELKGFLERKEAGREVLLDRWAGKRGQVAEMLFRGTLKVSPGAVSQLRKGAQVLYLAEEGLSNNPSLMAWTIRMLRAKSYHHQDRYDFSSAQSAAQDAESKLEQAPDFLKSLIQEDVGFLQKLACAEGDRYIDFKEMFEKVADEIVHVSQMSSAPEYRSIRAKGRSCQEVFEAFEKAERAIALRGRKLLNESGTKIVEFEDGSAWFDLGVSYSQEEADAMAHCGNKVMGHDNGCVSNETLLSLRYPAACGLWRPVATFVYQKDIQVLTEMKGFNNRKPDSDQHEKICELLLQDKLPVTGLLGGQYKRDQDFSLYDLSPSLQKKVIEGNIGIVDPVLIYRHYGEDRERFYELLNRSFSSYGIAAEGSGLNATFQTVQPTSLYQLLSSLNLNRCQALLWQTSSSSHAVKGSLTGQEVRKRLGRLSAEQIQSLQIEKVRAWGDCDSKIAGSEQELELCIQKRVAEALSLIGVKVSFNGSAFDNGCLLSASGLFFEKYCQLMSESSLEERGNNQEIWVRMSTSAAMASLIEELFAQEIAQADQFDMQDYERLMLQHHNTALARVLQRERGHDHQMVAANW